MASANETEITCGNCGEEEAAVRAILYGEGKVNLCRTCEHELITQKGWGEVIGEPVAETPEEIERRGAAEAEHEGMWMM
jgi:hypothetical protein